MSELAAMENDDGRFAIGKYIEKCAGIAKKPFDEANEEEEEEDDDDRVVY